MCGAREGEGEGGIEGWLMLTSIPVMRERERNREEEREGVRGREGGSEQGKERLTGRERQTGREGEGQKSILFE